MFLSICRTSCFKLPLSTLPIRTLDVPGRSAEVENGVTSFISGVAELRFTGRYEHAGVYPDDIHESDLVSQLGAIAQVLHEHRRYTWDDGISAPLSEHVAEVVQTTQTRQTGQAGSTTVVSPVEEF